MTEKLKKFTDEELKKANDTALKYFGKDLKSQIEFCVETGSTIKDINSYIELLIESNPAVISIINKLEKSKI